MAEKCIHCGKEIEGEAIPVYPGKVPGAYREKTEVEVPHTKMMPVMEDVEVGLEVEGKVMVVVQQQPVMQEVTYMKHRTVYSEWKTDGDYSIPYRHADCPK